MSIFGNDAPEGKFTEEYDLSTEQETAVNEILSGIDERNAKHFSYLESPEAVRPKSI